MKEKKWQKIMFEVKSVCTGTPTWLSLMSVMAE